MEELMKDFQLDLDQRLTRVVRIQNEISSLQTELNSVYTDLREFLKKISKQTKENSAFKIKKSSSDENDIVKFNVGGTVFSTFKATISKKIPKPSLLKEFYGSNLLENMMNGEIDVTYDENQTIFIDRSSKHFNYILDYLRTANTAEDFNMPKKKSELHELIREARFYQINALKDSAKDLYMHLFRNSNRQEKLKSDQDSDSDIESNSIHQKRFIKKVISEDSVSKEKSHFNSAINLDQNHIGNSQKVTKENFVEKQEIIKSYSIEQETIMTINKTINGNGHLQQKIEQKVPIVEKNKIAQVTHSQPPVQFPQSPQIQEEVVKKILSPIPQVPSKETEPVNIQIKNQEAFLETFNEKKESLLSNAPIEASNSMSSSVHQNGNLDDSFVSIKVSKPENPKILNDSQHLTSKTESSSLVRTSESSSVISQGKASNDLSQSLKETYTYFKNCFISYLTSTKAIYISFENFQEQIAKIQPIIDNCLDPYDTKSSKLCIGQYKEDEAFYRCRVLQWSAEKNEATCVFIDFGNTETVCIDTITKMSGHLRRVKPLALYCKLEDEFEIDSNEFKQISELTNSETRFDIKVKTAELESFYGAKNYDYGPITVEIRTSVSNVIVNKTTLGQKHLWQTTDLANTQSSGQIKPNDSAQNKQTNSEWENVKEAK
jgi:hypothetical protein